MATNMNELADSIQRALKDKPDPDVVSRRKMVEAAHAVIQALEFPEDQISRLWYGAPSTMATTRVLVDLKAFKIISSSKEPRSAAEIAKEARADPTLVARLLKQVAAEGYLTEVSADTYTASPSTHVLASPGCEGMIKDMFSYLRIAHHCPAFFKETGYANPTNERKSIFMDSFNTDQHYFEWVFAREERAKAFHDHMSWKTLGPKWFGNSALIASVFPKQISDQDALLVDLGGNVGTDLVAFSKTYPDKSGRLIVQDLPTVIEGVDSTELAERRIEAMAHDMFTPQPIHGAQVYYMKMVLHDWPDAECVKALKNLKPALVPGHSRILLNEIVVPDTNASWSETSFDILMMAVHSAQERRESDWQRLVDKVPGLRLKKVWDVPGALEKVIEIEAE